LLEQRPGLGLPCRRELRGQGSRIGGGRRSACGAGEEKRDNQAHDVEISAKKSRGKPRRRAQSIRQVTVPCPSARYSALRISSRRLTVRWNSKLPSPAG